MHETGQTAACAVVWPVIFWDEDLNFVIFCYFFAVLTLQAE